MARIERGHLEWWGRGKDWHSAPGSVLIKEPGDVHRDLAHAGTTVFTAAILPMREFQRFAETGKVFSLSDALSRHTRPVRRAREYLRAQLADSFTLDDVANDAALDKFHLCRAFREQVGMPPHAYLTHLRVQRARQLLTSGLRASELAPRVGFYDQSQLTRHFKRIVGVTPGRYRSETSCHG